MMPDWWRLKPQKSFQEVWDRNIWVTTSGMFSLAPMSCLLKTTNPERIIFSVDHPFTENENGKVFMERLKESGMVTESEYEGIAYKNAAKLLRLNGFGMGRA
jgi:predicted TIM-barrel fold metal-dependent hydrolase